MGIGGVCIHPRNPLSSRWIRVRRDSIVASPVRRTVPSSMRIPLMVVIGASDELPESAELDALFDKFLLRLHLAPVSKGKFPSLLRLQDNVQPNCLMAGN